MLARIQAPNPRNGLKKTYRVPKFCRELNDTRDPRSANAIRSLKKSPV